jgi:hypothetical protein
MPHHHRPFLQARRDFGLGRIAVAHLHGPQPRAVATIEIWPATEWPTFKALVRELPEVSGLVMAHG